MFWKHSDCMVCAVCSLRGLRFNMTIGFLTRILASGRVSDFTICHPSWLQLSVNFTIDSFSHACFCMYQCLDGGAGIIITFRDIKTSCSFIFRSRHNLFLAAMKNSMLLFTSRKWFSMHTTDSQFETYCKLGRGALPLMAYAGRLHLKG